MDLRVYQSLYALLSLGGDSYLDESGAKHDFDPTDVLPAAETRGLADVPGASTVDRSTELNNV